MRSRGEAGPGGGESGDLYLRVRLAPHRISAWKRAVTFTTIWRLRRGARCSARKCRCPRWKDRQNSKIPAGAQVGQRFRLRERGLPKTGGGRTDLYVQVGFVLPENLNDEERALWEQFAAAGRAALKTP